MATCDGLPTAAELGDFVRRLRTLADAADAGESPHLATLVADALGLGLTRWYTAAVRQGADSELRHYLHTASAVLGCLAARRMAQRDGRLRPPIPLDEAAGKLRGLAAGLERLVGVDSGADVASPPNDHYMPEADVLRVFVLHRNVLRRFLDRHPEIKPERSDKRSKRLPLLALVRAIMQDDRLAAHVKTEKRIKRNMARLDLDAKYQRAVEAAILGR